MKVDLKKMYDKHRDKLNRIPDNFFDDLKHLHPQELKVKSLRFTVVPDTIQFITGFFIDEKLIL